MTDELQPDLDAEAAAALAACDRLDAQDFDSESDLYLHAQQTRVWIERWQAEREARLEAEAERDEARRVARELAANCLHCKGKGKFPYDVGGELVQSKYPDFLCPVCGSIRAANPWLGEDNI